uniref:NADH-ubiquinone oxidoreductase chain 3 n=1 Tax=Elasmosoma sp. QL-2014 TaxID=1491720 RepID=A0A0U1X263_9HYME|nr:NADH dehydrogenase subunit 3 [Elasmosoma sp. QL-2014]
MLLLCFLFIVILFIGGLLFMVGVLISMKNKFFRSKSSPFECGFESLSLMRLPFSIHFYLIAILFLLFDIEVIYLFSMNVMSYKLSGSMWGFSVVVILIILYLGLEYEKSEGLLSWVV